MAASANAPLQYLEPASQREMYSLPVSGSSRIYHGSFVELLPTGYARAFEGGGQLVGIAEFEFYNSSTTDGAAADIGTDGNRGMTKIRVCRTGSVVLPLTSVSDKDIGRPVFALTDNTIGFYGHPDGYVGIVTGVFDTNYAMVRLAIGDRVPVVDGVLNNRITGTQLMTSITAAGSAILFDGGWKATVVGAVFGSGSFGNVVNVAGGELKALLGTTSEVENITLETALLMDITYGMSLRVKGRCSTLGPGAGTIYSRGLVTLATSTMTTTKRALVRATTAGDVAAFLQTLGNSANIVEYVDDNTTVTADVDTTIDNSLTVNRDEIIIIRPNGDVELYIDGARVLGSTALSVGAPTTYFGGMINLEKTATTDAGAVNLQYAEAKGASVPA